MATQRDVQQLIQSLTPSAVNNGNPNTVYNQPMPQGGYVPPTYDPGTNTWRINPGPPALGVNWQQMALGQTFTPGTGGWNVGQPVAFNPTTNPPTGGGGGATNPITVNPPPVTPQPPSTGGGGGGGDLNYGGAAPGRDSPEGTMANDLYRDLFTGQLGGAYYNPGAWMPAGYQAPSAPSTGGNSSSIGWREVLDALVPGNIYHSGTQQWNPWGMLDGAGDLAGVPIRQLLDGASSLYGDDVSTWPSFLQDRFMADLNNKIGNYENQFQDFMNKVSSDTQKKVDEDLNSHLEKLKLSYNSDADAEAARKEAEAKAAQEFVAALTSPSANLQRMHQQSVAATKKMFGGKER